MSTELVSKLHTGAFRLSRPNTNIFVLRHANAVAANGGHDNERRISDKGKKQCAAMKSIIASIQIDAVIRSPLPRVGDTLMEVAGEAILALPTRKVPELFIESGVGYDSGVVDVAYEMLGNVGLADILKHKCVAAAMDRFAANALNATHNALDDLSDKGEYDELNVLLIGHGWFIPMMVHYLTGTEIARRHVLHKGMGECDLYQIGLDAGGTPIWKVFPCPI